MSRLGFLTLAATFLSTCTACLADRPTPAPETLLEMSSHTIQGKVIRIYTANEDKGKFQYTYQIAAIHVEDVEKGDGISKGDLIYVKSWRKTWIGKEPLPPDCYGQPRVPSVGESTRVFLKQKNKGLFDVLEPGGFHSVPSK